jgi:uncharacterized protein (DUF2267 family)
VNKNRNQDNPVSFIDRTVEKTHVWLLEVSRSFGVDDKHVAYLVLRSVLHALRDRLDVESSAHLAAQLPMLVRGLYYEGWDPTDKPERMSYEEFLVRIEHDALLKGTSEAEDAARAVIAVLWKQLGEGTMSKVISILPGDFARLL